MTTVSRHRQVLRAGPAVETIDGPGLLIRRAIPDAGRPGVGPFILLDHFGPTPLAPNAAFPPNPHPHAGMETLTYLLDGSLEHQDSAGNTGVIEAGEAQWMRAGRGVIHDEGPGPSIRERGGDLQALQLWINLPKGQKHVAPAFRVHRREAIPRLAVGDAELRLIAGDLAGARGPVDTFAQPFAAHIVFAAGGEARIRPPPDIELGLYVIAGGVRVGSHAPLGPHDFADLGDGDALTLSADGPTELLLLGGPPLDAPLVRHGPFVMNSRAEIEAAIRDYQAGRMGVLERVSA
ncbi:MAG: pirin family protein [Caulobacter sp.]|nr:pirin family protein [Caulobacter sp.]